MLKRILIGVASLIAVALLISMAMAAQEADLQRAAREVNLESQMPGGVERVTERLSNQFNVPRETITDLRGQRLGFGEIAILLALSQRTGRSTDELLQEFRSGKGWGRIARDNNLNLGSVVSDVNRAAPSRRDTDTSGRPARVEAPHPVPGPPTTPGAIGGMSSGDNDRGRGIGQGSGGGRGSRR